MVRVQDTVNNWGKMTPVDTQMAAAAVTWAWRFEGRVVFV